MKWQQGESQADIHEKYWMNIYAYFIDLTMSF